MFGAYSAARARVKPSTAPFADETIAWFGKPCCTATVEKGAVEGLTLALAAEYAPNIRVNCIAPSLTNSKISNFLLKNEKMAESIAKMHPLKRIGEGADSASVAKFLLTDESSWITGQIFGVDGGRSSVA
jgi:NAD(P)-dependent dehydrogenase (short-subunit alcohol dehydrogenase family)